MKGIKSGVIVALGIVLSAQVVAAEEIDSVGVAGSAAVVGGLTALEVFSTTGGIGAVSEATGMGWIAFGIIAGTIREIQTDPAKDGKYRFNYQTTEPEEDSKWEAKAGTRWKGLKAYDEPGNGPRLEPISPISENKKWQRDPSGSYLMVKVS